MIGNDIVDLHDADCLAGSQHKRFDFRVFTNRERALLRASNNSNGLRWSLWAAKEASYKLQRKKLWPAPLGFAHRQHEVSINRNGQMWVTYADTCLPVTLQQRDDHVHAVVTAAVPPGQSGRYTHQGIVRLEQAAERNPSHLIRKLACRSIAFWLDCDPAGLSIQTNDRIPSLVITSGAALGSLSLSHHGRYLAFSYSVSAAELNAAGLSSAAVIAASRQPVIS